MSVSCPDCAAPLPPVVGAGCPACGLPLRGPAAARLWQVDQELTALRTERIDLIAALRAGDLPTGAPAGAVTGPQDVAARRPARAARIPALSGRWSPQQVLLAAGVVLLLTAAVVFVAIGWTRFGVAGQCALLLAATGGAVAVSRTLARRALRASTEAVAVLAVGLAALDLDAAQRLGLVDVGAEPYAVAALALLCGLAAAAARLVPLSTAYPVAAVLAAGTVPAAVLELVEGGRARTAVVASAAALVGAAATLLAHRERRPAPASTRAVLLLVTALWSLVGARAGVAQAYSRPLADGGALALLPVAGVAAGLLLLARAMRLPRSVRRVARVGLAAVVVTTMAAVAHHGGPTALVSVSVAASLGLAAVAVRGHRSHLLLGGTAALAWVSGLAAELEPFTREPGERALWLGALALATGLVALSRTGARRAIAAGVAGTTLVAGVFCGVADLPAVARVAALLVVVTALTITAGVRLGMPEEPALAAAAVVGALVALTADGDRPDVAPQVAVVLGACGLLALGYATLRARGWVSVAGVLLCSAATWTLSADASVDVVEAYTLPLSALALGVGAIRLRHHPLAPSWTTVGPGVSAGLLPSALASVADDGLTRPLLVLLAAVLTTLAGTGLRWQAPVVTGALAATVVAVSQLGRYAAAAPRWVSLALAGAVLLSLGARYEQRRRDAREAASWLAALR